MKLNHLNLPVSDIAANRDFFTRYFGMTITMEVGKNFLAMLEDEGDMVLNLSRFGKEPSEIQYHPDFHVGFLMASNGEVDEAHARLAIGDVPCDAPQQLPGRYAFYVTAPGGFVVEVAHLK